MRYISVFGGISHANEFDRKKVVSGKSEPISESLFFKRGVLVDFVRKRQNSRKWNAQDSKFWVSTFTTWFDPFHTSLKKVISGWFWDRHFLIWNELLFFCQFQALEQLNEAHFVVKLFSTDLTRYTQVWE